MKYIFSIDDNRDGGTQLFSVEAENEEAAQKRFILKCFPLLIYRDFDYIADALADSLDIVISNLGCIEVKEI